MIFSRSAVSKALVATALVVPMSAAIADVINFFNGSDLYAQMTTSGNTSFSLNFVGTNVAASAFINELFLDGPAGTFTNTTTAGVTTPSAVYSLNGFNGGGGGGNIYDWRIDFPQANNSGRFTVGETATWDITGTNSNQWAIEKLHINAFNGRDSIKLDGCIDGSVGCGGGGGSNEVPEPASLALVGLGLLGASLMSRRKKA